MHVRIKFHFLGLHFWISASDGNEFVTTRQGRKCPSQWLENRKLSKLDEIPHFAIPGHALAHAFHELLLAGSPQALNVRTNPWAPNPIHVLFPAIEDKLKVWKGKTMKQ